MSMIELHAVTKLYGRVIGVNDLTLDLPEGAYGLLGPNGSGKTTLLNLVTGQIKPTLGSIRVLGMSPRSHASFLEDVGFCPGIDGLYSNVSGREWVTYLLELYGWPRSDAVDAAERALELVGMTESMRRPLGTYSRGMRQRVKLAQAIAHEPSFLILDEPFNGLDPVSRHQMTELLREWIEQGKNLLVSSHILHEVEAITPSFLLICGGRLLASGSARDVQEILVDIPSEITLKTDQPQRLATVLLEQGVVESVQLSDAEPILTVATKNPGDLYKGLPAWIRKSGIHVAELQSQDESLQSLFNSLMRIHRGEL